MVTRSERSLELERTFLRVRSRTERLAATLSPEDQTVQSMPDASPTKWHLAHTSWFFETFLLEPELAGYVPYHPAFAYLFNSYYEAVGPRQPRPERGLLTRPSLPEVLRYRSVVDAAMGTLFAGGLSASVLDTVELGVHHEQQHQELLLMDLKHLFSCNPLLPAYAEPPSLPAPTHAPGGQFGWVEHPGGTADIGHCGGGFAFDNESPRHLAQLVPFALADRLVTCGQWLDFIADGGYTRPELWLSEGWATVQAEGWTAPLYWLHHPGHSRSLDRAPDLEGAPHRDPHDRPRVFTLFGSRPVDPDAPVSHVSYYEADAFARWMGARLPTEAEWEALAPLPEAMAEPDGAPRADPDRVPRADPEAEPDPVLEPLAQRHPGDDFYGSLWQWTASSYSPYPGFRAGPGAIGEYNGKFMVNQQVLRGSACITPPGHARRTYRNFFPARARWAYSGVRLAKDR